jgi:hypothetical protein
MPRVEIHEADFRALVGGKVLTCKFGRQEFEIVLSLAWRNMLNAIIEAVREPQRGPPDPPEAREFLSMPRRNNRK